MDSGNAVNRGPLHASPALLAALVAGAAAASTLAGWILQAPELRSLVRGWPAMSPLSAVMLLACVCALLALTIDSRPARVLALSSALLATLLGLLACLELAGLKLGLERLVLAGTLARAHQPARPGVWSALALMLCGALLLGAPRWTRTVRALRGLAALALAVGVCNSIFGFSWPADPHVEDMGALLAIGLAATILGSTRPLRVARVRSWLTTPIILTSCLVLITTAAAVASNDQAHREAMMSRASIATRLRTETFDTLDATIARLQDVAASVSDHWPAGQSDFAEIAGGLLSQQALGGVGLIEFLPAAARPGLERRYHHAIEVFTTAGQRRDPPQPDYFLSRAAVHRADQRSNLWVDVGTEPKRRATLLGAARSDTPQATPPVDVLGSGQAATALYVPVYRRGAPIASVQQRLAALRGFVGGSYRYDLLGQSLRGALPTHVAFSVADAGTVLFHRGRPAQAAVSTIAVAGRRWTLAIGTPPVDHSLLATVLLVGGILTLLLGALSLQAARRERYALALVDRRLAERERAERALDAAERRFRSAFAEAPIGMAITALEGGFQQVNRALTEITGYGEQRLLALAFASELTHPEDRPADRRAAIAMRAGEISVYDVEKRYIHAAGHTVWVAVHTTLICDDDGTPAYFLSQIEDITARRRYELRLQHMADHDPLTGLFNRRAFERLLEAHLARGERYGHEGALIMLDLDDFKQVNDTLGHSAGDELIVRVGNALSARLRNSDTIARLGGDEFAILLPTGDQSSAEQLARALLETIRGERAARGVGGRARPISASVGIATLRGSGQLSADEVMINADLAMYDAKEAGRNRIETYGDCRHGQARIETRLEWVERIRSALEEDRLVLYAQPVVHAASRRVTQYELLVRMIDPHGEVIGPASFLPIAERFGLIRDIDHWVVGRAIAVLGEQARAGSRPTVEINLSGQSLGDPELAEMISDRLAQESVDPTQLVFEVTETTAISNIGAAQSFAGRLAELGCRFALDDFGAGFGSFYYLKHLPFDFIKIDGEFVRSCTSNATDRLVIRAVVDLARGMGKRTIAEFVGDEQTFLTLAELGVDYAQGYHLGKPAPVAQVLSGANTAAPANVPVHGEGLEAIKRPAH